MQKEFQYRTEQIIKIQPNKIAIYTQKANAQTPFAPPPKRYILQQTKNFKTSAHNFELSKAAQKKIKDKISWLYHFAPKRNITSYSKKIVIGFKIGFYTFTLPSKQMHTSQEITSKCFNQLLTELRTRTGMKNYLWKLEYQKNGNVHYHLATDIYLDFFFIKSIWNRIINKLGYVDRYKEKFAQMSLTDFIADYEHADLSEDDIILKFNDMKLNGAGEPPSVNVQGVRSFNNISAYIAKYFSKSADPNALRNDYDTPANCGRMRLWFCSLSLSACQGVTMFHDRTTDFINDFIFLDKSIKVFFHDFCTCIYYNVSKISNGFKGIFYKILHDYKLNINYPSIATCH